jgi:hypothetical protein
VGKHFVPFLVPLLPVAQSACDSLFDLRDLYGFLTC